MIKKILHSAFLLIWTSYFSLLEICTYHLWVHSIISSWKEAANWNLEAFFPTVWSRFQTEVILGLLNKFCPSRNTNINTRKCVSLRWNFDGRLHGERLSVWQTASAPHRLKTNTPEGRARVKLNTIDCERRWSVAFTISSAIKSSSASDEQFCYSEREGLFGPPCPDCYPCDLDPKTSTSHLLDIKQ